MNETRALKRFGCLTPKQQWLMRAKIIAAARKLNQQSSRAFCGMLNAPTPEIFSKALSDLLKENGTPKYPAKSC